jgi:N-methylhydantoinase B/oxoprolinase/acetone carboxylase alpha subunit
LYSEENKPFTTEKMTIDPITFEVVSSSFKNITDLMGDTLKRVSRSPIIYDSVDFSNALFDDKCQLFAQTTNVPVHLASMHFSVEESIRRFGSQLYDGDIVILNDPYRGGTHIPDVTFSKPVFFRGKLLCYAGSRGHWTDLGGGAVGSRMPTAVHIAQEGLRIPPVKVFEEGKLVEAVRDFIGANTRVPDQNLADMEAHRAALLIAEREMKKLAERYGVNTIRECMEQLLSYTERRTRAAILRIPDGSYSARDYVDCDGVSTESYYIRVALSVERDEITVDFTGTDEIAQGGINYPYAGTCSAVYWSLKFFLDPEAPANAGMYRPIHIILPDESFINARWPAPVFMGNMVTSEKIADAIWQALSEAIKDKMVAMPYGDSNGVTLGGVSGTKSFVFMDLPPGGWGGTFEHDGMNATYSRQGNCMDLDIELAERLYPIRVNRKELIQNSGGAGKFRGGLSLRIGFTPTDCDVAIGHTTSRTKEGPPGIFGGKSGRAGRSIRNYETSHPEVFAGMSDSGTWQTCMYDNLKLKKGEDITLELQGGGGWGNPYDRDPDRVLEDVLDGYVSIEDAENKYGVVIESECMEINWQETYTRRSKP